MIKKRGFTLIELVMVIVIIAIISIVGADLMFYLVRNSVFLPNKLNVEMIGQDILDIMVEGYQTEGYQKAKGLRFSTIITTAGNNNVVFNNSNGQIVQFLWNNLDKKIYRTVNGCSQQTIPYYLHTGIYIEPKDSNPIFTYYDASEANTSNPSNVRRVKIEFRVRSGSGSYQDWQSQLDFASSIAVRRLQ